MYFVLTAIVIVLILAFIAWGAWHKTKSRRLPSASAQCYDEAWKQVMLIEDDHRKIIEAEKIIDSALKELGYAGTFADKLRTAGPRFSDVQSLWNSHKLRNRIAHEMNVKLDGREVRVALFGFEKALKDLT